MASQAVIGALRVVIGADSAALTTGLKKAESRLQRFGQTIGGVMRVAEAALLAGVAALGVALNSTFKEIDRLGKLAQSIGVPVEQLSALKFAAELSGASVDDLGKALQRLARNTLEAAQGLQTPVRAFQQLGVQFQNADGSLRTLNELLPELADRFAALPDGPEKTGLAMQLLGRAGAQLIPLLNNGSAGIKALTDEAKTLGLVIDEKTFRATERFNDNLSRLGDLLSGVLLGAAARLAPTLAKLTDAMVVAVKQSSGLDTAINSLALALQSAATTGAVLLGVLRGLLQIVPATLGALKDLVTLNFSGAREAAVGLSETLEKTLLGTVDQIRRIWGLVGDAAVVASKRSSDASAAAGGIIKSTKDQLENYLAAKQKEIAALQAERGALGLSASAREKARIVAEALAIAEQNHIAVSDTMRAKIEQVAGQYVTLTGAMGAARSSIEATRTPFEQFTETMTRLNEAFAFGQRDPATYARAVAQAQDRLVQATPAAQALGGALENAFDRAFESGAKLSDILRDLTRDLTKTLANQAFRFLLYGNAGQGGASSGLFGALFAGLPKFAAGGSFTVGGSGGVDSQLVAFRATPGEAVNVGGAADGARVNVQVNNYAPGTETRQTRRGGPDGETVVIDIVKRKMAGGAVDDVLGSRFGLRPNKVK